MLDDEYEDDLYKKSILIFGIYGLVSLLTNAKIAQEPIKFFFSLFELLIGILVSILIGMAISFLLYKLGKWIGGKATSTEILAVVSYSYIPVIIVLAVVNLLKQTGVFTVTINTANVRNTILLLSCLLSLKILVMGMIKFNRYSFVKGLINASPIIVFFIGILWFYSHYLF